VVRYLTEHPTEHFDDILRRALITPAHHICLALRHADRNHPTRISLMGDVFTLFSNQLNRPIIPAFTDIRQVPGSLRPPQVDLTDVDGN